ncbi:MAG TPA: FAD/NAD(P)-binding oxidoreductase [Solirubrobacteraceae bacterium]|nr:FAD/NAD(P)-binding oxidoreductase [Solirubrobacteraceae bacterium]
MGSPPLRILIAGGGVAGLEALLALRDLAGDRVELTLLSPNQEFVYRPMAVAEPFGRGLADRDSLAEIAADVQAELVRGALVSVDAGARIAVTETGSCLSYDALLIAVGAVSEPPFRRVLTWTPEADAAVFGGLLRDLDEGYVKRVAFVVPPGVAWALPAYELALMTAWQAWGMGHDDVRVTIFTPEDAPLGLFGAQATAAVRQDLEEAGIEAEVGVYVVEDPQIPGRLVLHPGARALDAERIVALPRALGPGLRGVPSDARGFVPTDLHGRVAGVEGVWAAGDATAFAVKQGGLASQQADAAAESIAARAGAELQPRPYRPVLRGMMLTGRGKAWMRHELAGEDEGAAVRRALWWPPTKIAGRYLSPYLAARHGREAVGEGPRPDGHPVELDLERDLPAAADALRRASLRTDAARARFERQRAEARRQPPTG